MDCGKNLAKRLEKKFLEEDFDGTPLSVIAPASLMKKVICMEIKTKKVY